MSSPLLENIISVLTGFGLNPEVVYENGSPVLLRVPLRCAAPQQSAGHGGSEADRLPSAAAGSSAGVGPGAAQPSGPPPFEELPERIRWHAHCLHMAPPLPSAEDRLRRAFWLGTVDARRPLRDRSDLVDVPMSLPYNKCYVVLRSAARHGGMGPSVVTTAAHLKALVTDDSGAESPYAISRGFNSFVEVESYLAGAGEPPELAAHARRWRPAPE